MKFISLLVSLGVFVVPCIGMCQSFGSLGYQDADNEYQAVGMMEETIDAAQTMKRECRSRFPELGKEFSTNLSSWERTEAEVLRKTQILWAAMEKKNPKFRDVPVLVDTAVKGQFKMVEKSQMGEVRQVEREYCHNYFADLASGIWRKRTPRAYAYIDKAQGK